VGGSCGQNAPPCTIFREIAGGCRSQGRVILSKAKNLADVPTDTARLGVARRGNVPPFLRAVILS